MTEDPSTLSGLPSPCQIHSTAEGTLFSFAAKRGSLVLYGHCAGSSRSECSLVQDHVQGDRAWAFALSAWPAANLTSRLMPPGASGKGEAPPQSSTSERRVSSESNTTSELRRRKLAQIATAQPMWPLVCLYSTRLYSTVAPRPDYKQSTEIQLSNDFGRLAISWL